MEAFLFTLVTVLVTFLCFLIWRIEKGYSEYPKLGIFSPCNLGDDKE